MSSGAEYFLNKTLGSDFLESLTKFELWKPGTRTVIDHEEIKTALHIVPRVLMSMLIRELVPMQLNDTKEIDIPVPTGKALVRVTKHERDVYSGEVEHDNKRIVDFKYRSIPGVGLVIMSAFELYDVDGLAEKNVEVRTHDYSAQIQKIIDERLALHDLVGKVVDKKIMEKDAVHQLVLRKLTELMDYSGPKQSEPEKPELTKVIFKKEEKKKLPLAEFLESKKKKNEYSVVMAKGEKVDCPDCGKNIFNGKLFSGCVCLGDDMERKVFIKKEQDGIKVRFSKGWDEENIEMLLEVLRNKKNV